MTATDEMVCKYQFVKGLSQLFAKWGDGRYDEMKRHGFRYQVDGNGQEVVENLATGRKCAVTGDSLPAIVRDMVAGGLLEL